MINTSLKVDSDFSTFYTKAETLLHAAEAAENIVASAWIDRILFKATKDYISPSEGMHELADVQKYMDAFGKIFKTPAPVENPDLATVNEMIADLRMLAYEMKNPRAKAAVYDIGSQANAGHISPSQAHFALRELHVVTIAEGIQAR